MERTTPPIKEQRFFVIQINEKNYYTTKKTVFLNILLNWTEHNVLYVLEIYLTAKFP